MRKRLAHVLGVVLVAGGLLLTPAPADAASGLWQMSTTWLGWFPKIERPGQQAVTVACPTGSTPVSGDVNASGDDLRRTYEYVGFGSGESYSVGLYNETGGGGEISVEPRVRCVPMSYFSAYYTTDWAYFGINGYTHLAAGTVTCASGYSALSAYVNITGGGGTTLLTSTPTINGQGWTARGWADFASQSLQVKVNCVATADLSAWRTFTHYDSVGWGATASATCGSGMVPINGGTVHVGGDTGAITIHQHPTANGWTSITESLSTGSILTTVRCVPGANPTVSITGSVGLTNQASATWSFSATDPASSGGYGTSLTCTFHHPEGSTGAAPCSSPVSLNGLSEGLHTIGVIVTTSDGRTAGSNRTVDVDTIAPGTSFAEEPATTYATASPSVGFTISDAHPVPQVDCWLDDAAPAPCALAVLADYRGSRTVSLGGVSDGAHVLHVRPRDAATNSATADLPFIVDATAPAVSMTKPTATVTVARSATAAWSASDGGSGIRNFDTRYRRVPYDGSFGSLSPATTLTGTTRSYSALVPGSTYCFSSRARDKAGNVSGYADASCTAIPLDDRALTRSPGWTATTRTGWFQDTLLTTSTQGATLKVSNASLKRIGLVAQTCPTCGVVGVYVGGTLVAQVDLASSTTAHVVRQVTFGQRDGTVTVKVLTSSKPVRIDGLAMSRM